jgi:hypothetical protein
VLVERYTLRVERTLSDPAADGEAREVLGRELDAAIQSVSDMLPEGYYLKVDQEAASWSPLSLGAMVSKAQDLLPAYSGNTLMAANQAWILAGCPDGPTVADIDAAL